MNERVTTRDGDRVSRRGPTRPFPQIVRRVQVGRRSALRSWREVARRTISRRVHYPLLGYTSAILTISAVTVVIGLVLGQHVRIANISSLYLLAVLGLAALFGRGPAVLASFLAFLAFDFFFVAPIHVFTVGDPAEWASLLMLLATALVTGQLTAMLRAWAHTARQQQQQTVTLYELAQLIAAGADLDTLVQSTAERVLTVFAPVGVEASTIVLPDAGGHPVERAAAPRTGRAIGALSLRQRGRAYLAADVLRGGGVVGPAMGTDGDGGAKPLAVLYIPLRSGGRTVGVLGISGDPGIHRLVTADGMNPNGGQWNDDALATLFDAFRDQIALGIERATLQQAAVHAEALRESDHLKDVLLGSVTHDLRTPLASIKAITSSLLQPGMRWSEDEHQEMIESIDESVDRLSRLVSNLLDLSRLEAGVAVPRKDWHLIGEVVSTVLDRLDLAGQTRNRTVELDLPADLPLVLMDHEQIEEVLTNLIENALKYSPANTPIRIWACVREVPAELEVSVTDQGMGIPAAELDAIFGKFYRVQHVQMPWAPARPPTGTGLGLAICRAILQAHGGVIWAQSQPEAGTTFTFTLPLTTGTPQGELPEVIFAPGADDTQPHEQETGVGDGAKVSS